jgi:hypothetical protein
MKKSCKILAVTYGEIQSWYRYGEIKVNSNRIAYIGLTDLGAFDTDSSAINSLLDNSPQLSFDDEEGILLIQLTAPSKRVSLSEYDSLIIKFIDIEKIIPLTDRAKRILESRLSDFNINLSEPFFEKQVNQMWFGRRLRDALLGGDALVELLFNDAEQYINEPLRNSIAHPIKEIDYGDAEINLDRYKKTWLSKAFSYSRGKPPKLGSFDYFVDFGTILKEFISEDDSKYIKKYKDKLKEPHSKYKESESKIDVLLCDRSLSEASVYLLDKLPLAFPAPIEGLILFLKFRQNFIDADQLIDPELLSEELKEYSKIDFSYKVIGVWLLGCYAGFQRISPIIYAANSEKIAFYRGEKLLINKIKAVVNHKNAVEVNKDIKPLFRRPLVKERFFKKDRTFTKISR